MKSSHEDNHQGDFIFECEIGGKWVRPSPDTNAVLTTLRSCDPASFKVRAFFRGAPNEAIPSSARWGSSRPDIAAIEGSGAHARISVRSAGVTNITVEVGAGRDLRTARFTLVEAADMLLYGPDGRYYKVQADSWTRTEVNEKDLGDVTRDLVRGGSPFFTNGPVETALLITCYVVNLASMCNDVFPGPKFGK